ncbi:MAG: TonB-dependent receptor [Candidatus Electryonea clarkiae]|nr:TonB-dependent receptor [Candidatus Electryonea clarkiae]MDP8287823.1 TonB-dependent receptor [Candidatus Electryonea clarkiae]
MHHQFHKILYHKNPEFLLNKLFFTIVLLFSQSLILIPEALSIDREAQVCDISGYVFDEDNGETLPSANVLIKGTTRGSSTNLDGHFVIVDAPAQICTLQVRYIGYAIKEVIVDNTKQSSETLRIELIQDALSGEEVTFFGDKYEIWKNADDVSQVTFSARQVSRLPRLGEADIFRSLQLLPGVSGANDGRSGMYIRGGSPDQNLVILDGMTVYHVDHFFGVFSAFNTDAVKDIQLYKGGYPARYGGRLSSVVDLTGKSGNATEPTYGFGLNFLSANAILEAPLWEKGSFLFSARRSHVDLIDNGFYNKIFDTVTGYEEPVSSGLPGGGGGGTGGRQVEEEDVRPNFYFYDINSKVTLAPTSKDVFALSFYNGEDAMDNSQEIGGLKFRGLGDDINGVRTTNEISDWGNVGGSLKWSRQWHDRYHSKFLLARSNYYSNYEKNAGFNIEATNDSSSVFAGKRSFASEEINRINDLTFSLDNNWHVSRKHELGFGSMITDLSTDYQASVNDTITTLDISESSLQSAFYLEDKWQVLQPLELTLGFRGTYYDKTDQFYPEPRAAYKYSISDHITFKGAWGHYHQFINQVTNENVLDGSKDFWLVSDENLVPGFSEHRILGLSYENRKFLFEVQGYEKEMENLVEFSRRFRNDADYGDLFFFGDGVARGVEFLAQKKAGMMTGWISYTLGSVEHDFPKLNDEPFPADYDRTHEFKIVGNFTWGLYDFSSTWIYATGNAYTSPESQYFLETIDGEIISYIHVGNKNSSRLPDYHRLDLSVSRVFESMYDHRAEIGFSVFNLYNKDNVVYREYDLETSPIVVSDVLSLGFMPSLFFKFTY